MVGMYLLMSVSKVATLDSGNIKEQEFYLGTFCMRFKRYSFVVVFFKNHYKALPLEESHGTFKILRVYRDD